MMFYGQCNKCGKRWELGTVPTCVCPSDEDDIGQAIKRAIERINELEALNAELVEALRRVKGTGVFLGAIAQEMVDAVLAKVEASND